MKSSLQQRFEADGFSVDEWETFQVEGLIVRRSVFDAEETRDLLARCREFEAVAATVMDRVEGGFRKTLATSPAFARLVCDRRLLAPAYDLFGEMTALHGFDLFIRPPGGIKEHSWHFDGPRRLPYATFCKGMPPVLKFGIWLTDVDSVERSAYQYLPGSHRQPCIAAYGESGHLSDQKTLAVCAGDVSIHHADLWHRVSSNRGTTTRYNFFVTYSPSWIASREPFDEVEPLPDLPQLETLLRRYDDPTHRFKPPTSEIPLHPNADQSLMSGARLGKPPILSLLGLEDPQ